MNNLDLIPTDDLLDELEKRFDHGCFAGTTIDVTPPEQGDCDWTTITRFWGNKLTAWGAAGLIQHRIGVHVMARREEEGE